MNAKQKIKLVCITSFSLFLLFSLYTVRMGNIHRTDVSKHNLVNSIIVKKHIRPNFAIDVIKMSTSGLISYEGPYSGGIFGHHPVVDVINIIPELKEVYFKSGIVIWGYEFKPEYIIKNNDTFILRGAKGEKETMYFTFEEFDFMEGATLLFCEVKE